MVPAQNLKSNMPRLQEKGLGIWKAKRMFGFGKKKVDKAAWAETVYGQKLKNPERESEEQLFALTTGLLMQHHRIIIDSVRIIDTAKNAETRQGRMELCQRHYGDMLKLKPFCNKEQLAMVQNAEEATRGI